MTIVSDLVLTDSIHDLKENECVQVLGGFFFGRSTRVTENKNITQSVVVAEYGTAIVSLYGNVSVIFQ